MITGFNLLALASLATCLLIQSCTSSKIQDENKDNSQALKNNSSYLKLAKKVDNNSAPLIVSAKNIFENAAFSNYEHVANVDEKKGIYNLDCSGYISLALEKNSPQSLQELRSFSLAEIMKRKKHKRPLAKDFVAYFASLSKGEVVSEHWKSVQRITDLQPGDVLAWKTPEDMDTSNTGHVMIVKSVPKLNPENKQEYLVEIFDSTSSPHGKTDSRYSQKLTGIGEGTVGLFSSNEGKAFGYKWAGGESKKLKETEIRFARPLPSAASLSSSSHSK